MSGPDGKDIYAVFITDTAAKMLKDIKRSRGKQTYDQLKQTIRDLTKSPELQTQALIGILNGFRSLHSGRFRIVIRINDRKVHVYVVGVGWHTSGDRDDIYHVLQRMAESGRFDEFM